MERETRFISKMISKTMALILAGGRGSRLGALTNWRAKPAVPFGGKFRIIDFPLSNCLNSQINKIGIVTQYKSHSLIRHIQKGWGFSRGEGSSAFVELLPAQQRLDETSWYAGTANAVFQNIDIIRSYNPEYILILAGDHIYKMDYGEMLKSHHENRADMTVGCIEVPLADATGFGVMQIDDNHRVIRFQEKPQQPTPLPNDPNHALASMGIYVFNTAFLYKQLLIDSQNPNSSHDFGKDIIPSIIEKWRVFAHPFREKDRKTGEERQAYWRDVGTIDSYWKANIELTEVTPTLNLYDKEWPIWTYQEQTPPAKFVFNDEGRRGMAVDSLVSGGSIISGSHINKSLLFTNVMARSWSQVSESVILPDVEIGRRCKITRAVIDKGCKIPEDTVIGENIEEDRRRFYVTESGIVLVTPDMLGQDEHQAQLVETRLDSQIAEQDKEWGVNR